MSGNNYEAISRLNSLSLNRAAGKLLPPDWINSATLNVLALAQWGMQERRISVELPNITQDLVADEVNCLREENPDHVMRWIGELLQDDDLDSVAADHGAQIVLEAIRDLLVAQAPYR